MIWRVELKLLKRRQIGGIEILVGKLVFKLVRSFAGRNPYPRILIVSNGESDGPLNPLRNRVDYD